VMFWGGDYGVQCWVPSRGITYVLFTICHGFLSSLTATCSPIIL
jgi:hypothetical protein